MGLNRRITSNDDLRKKCCGHLFLSTSLVFLPGRTGGGGGGAGRNYNICTCTSICFY